MAFNYTQPILFRHCDPAGIVFYPRYFEMINDCVEAFFDQELNRPFAGMHPDNGVPTARIEAQFLSPSRMGDTITIRLDVTRLGGSSVDFNFHASCSQRTRFTASSTIVWVGSDGRPVRWPDSLRHLLEQHAKSPHQE